MCQYISSSFLALLHLLELSFLLVLQQLDRIAAWEHSSHWVLTEHSLAQITKIALDLLALHLNNLGHVLSYDLTLFHEHNNSQLHFFENRRNLRIIKKSYISQQILWSVTDFMKSSSSSLYFSKMKSLRESAIIRGIIWKFYGVFSRVLNISLKKGVFYLTN